MRCFWEPAQWLLRCFMQLYNKAVIIQYDGTNYSGWQWQTHSPSIQEELQKALKVVYKRDVNAVGSGRTDSGVHSIGQTANFITDTYIPDEAVVLGLNSILPMDISITKAWDVPLEFHAQKSAKSKTYLYRMYPSRVRSAFMHNRAWWVKGRLDLSGAAEILSAFEGTHDFTACCAAESLRENCVRTIYFTKFYKEGDVWCLEVNGSGFLHNMVRIITGTVVKFCRDGHGPERVRQMLETKNRKLGGPTAPAEGLYLKEVFY
ncbi:tRNA pseudouridine38-40 synthase [Seleniivibrio woodruffii]|uniref:tRNA pseudouridine synthase A n=2 Tax=Seleniivibrio woodruffii TaxID=1078050 RepID=A0A4R1KBF0_9BACT|nr:tRNA pseudouridine(38-40) synthase [Seleniivibrio woodruffii]TVZ35069.1 tRNA pseudouridine38-40 synthase [Seleniivibrio woodruffii]